jgi:hypothetical protein
VRKRPELSPSVQQLPELIIYNPRQRTPNPEKLTYSRAIEALENLEANIRVEEKLDTKKQYSNSGESSYIQVKQQCSFYEAEKAVKLPTSSKDRRSQWNPVVL